MSRIRAIAPDAQFDEHWRLCEVCVRHDDDDDDEEEDDDKQRDPEEDEDSDEDEEDSGYSV